MKSYRGSEHVRATETRRRLGTALSIGGKILLKVSFIVSSVLFV